MKSHNPFQVNPEKELQERKKYARKITREEFLNSKKQVSKKSADDKK